MKLFFLITLAFMYSLTGQWVRNGTRFCQYSNGEVHGYPATALCPLVIYR